MKIKTTIKFKVRRLSGYTRMQRPPAEQKLFCWLRQKWYLLQRDKMERELFHSSMILKNLAIVYQQMPMSTDFILEQLMTSSQALRAVYADILTAYRKGKGDAAFLLLCQRVQVPAAQKFAGILQRLDEINPAELVLQMQAFEETLSSERKTKAIARAERKSLITTLASTMTVFTVLLNFVVVVVFLDAMATLGQLF